MKRYNPYTLPPWLRNARNVCQQFIVPICIFQGIRTLLFPTAFDILLLGAVIIIAVAFYIEWI
jgi:hypothetical protein